MAILDEVKTALRISTNTFDVNELTPLINACKLDLSNAGVRKVDDSDPLIGRAIVLYTKANFGYSEDAGRWAQAYEALKNSLALSSDYNTEGPTP